MYKIKAGLFDRLKEAVDRFGGIGHSFRFERNKPCCLHGYLEYLEVPQEQRGNGWGWDNKTFPSMVDSDYAVMMLLAELDSTTRHPASIPRVPFDAWCEKVGMARAEDTL